MKNQVRLLILSFMLLISIGAIAQTEDMRNNTLNQDSGKMNTTMPQNKSKNMKHNQGDSLKMQNKKPAYDNRTRSDSNKLDPEKGSYNRDKSTPIVPKDTIPK